MVPADRAMRALRPGACGRILWALCASVLAHLWLLGGTPSVTIGISVPLPAHTLEVRLKFPGESVEHQEPAQEILGAQRAARPPDATGAGSATKPPSRAIAPHAGAVSEPAGNETPASDIQRLTPVRPDPVYYSVRELDVYPTPVVPLQFAYPAHVADARNSAEVLVRLRVDEAGRVDEVAVLSGNPPGDWAAFARAALDSARFNPGRREGRAVKSEMTVRISFDPAARAGTLR